ncbi:MAG: GNAT family N-acetyltransferase, partial [Deltaproteobacteria bacterium]
MQHSLDVIFRPRSVAVIGASNQPGKVGGEIFRKLLRTGFRGPVYPVNRKSPYVHSVKAYPSIREVPEVVDLAVVVVPAPHVVETVRDCAQIGVKGIVVITSGFKEIGTESGAQREAELVEIVRENGMRMIGPNCMGVINTEGETRLDATFAPALPLEGRVGFISQSGALGVTILDYANSLNLGVAMFASVGNKADVSGNDFLEYWKDDDKIRVILMYLESFGNPRKFIRLATEVSRKKPIVVVKSGRTAGGARAASSHTGSLAGLDHAFDALFHRCGVIRANSIEEMFDIAMAFTNQPIPLG